MSLAHLLNDASPSSDDSAPPESAPWDTSDAAYEPSSAQIGRRQSTGRRAAKRARKYEDDDGDWSEGAEDGGGGGGGGGTHLSTPTSTSRARHSASRTANFLKGAQTANEATALEEDYDDDDEDVEILLAQTEHIWRQAAHNYALLTHASRKQLEHDFVVNERTRHFETAARIHNATMKKMETMKSARASRIAQLDKERKELEAKQRRQQENERREQQRQQQVAAAAAASESRATSVDKAGDSEAANDPNESKIEIRRRKNREAARRRRDHEKAVRDRERGGDDGRSARSEEARSAYLLELERRANLTPEEREAEDKILLEKRQQAEEEAAAQLKALEAQVEANGGLGLRRRRKDISSFEDKITWDDLDDDGNLLPNRVGELSRRSSSAQPGALDGGLDSYLGPDGVWYDYEGIPLSGRRAGSEDLASDSIMSEADDDADVAATNGKKSTSKASEADLERRVWAFISKREIPKVNRVVQASSQSRQFFAKRVATVVAREARRSGSKAKGPKDAQVRAKRVMREVIAFSRGNEKRERESRKKAEKEAYDAARREEESREAKRQARKLNFLITQTELYSHFVGSKIKTSEAEESADTASDTRLAPPEQSASLKAALAATNASNEEQLKDLDFDNDDDRNLTQHARKNAEAAVVAAKSAASQFDQAVAAERVAAGGSAPKTALNLDGDELNFQNPSLPGADELNDVEQPKMLTCQLKDYQLKGLRWLANLYEQGINGILADEMGLGKTVQSIALMAYLAEKHDIWGPFLVIAPASTLHNWQQEITRFTPALKALPYWGNPKDRAVLRKFWNRKSIRYDKNAPYHIVVTSYQLVVQDEKYFQSVRWQYMVLDEAQAIKSATSTPIQNSMHELWALLHFIMPSLFDSHDEFSEWFSKDIESSAEAKGAMNEHQLRRLHMILKPFMLRRIKKNVQNELSDKIEIDVYCDLTTRQRAMYRTLKEHISITDLVARATSLNDDDSVKRLMNLIMQFRKVCNHPELFERADVTAPFAFSAYSRSGSSHRGSDMLEVPYAVNSTIQFDVPKLLYRDGGMLSVPSEGSRAGSDTLHLKKLMCIWTPEYLHKSLQEDYSTFAWMRALKLTPADVNRAIKGHDIIKVGRTIEQDARARDQHEHELLNDNNDKSSTLDLRVMPRAAVLPHNSAWTELGLVGLGELEQDYRLHSRLAKPDVRFYMDKAVAPAIDAFCSDRSFAWDQERERFDTVFSSAMFGVPLPSQNDIDTIDRFEATLPGLPPQGVLRASDTAQLPFPPMQVPQLRKLILDSGKLAKLDSLLKELKSGGHRCLVYFQMTRMIDLMEEYLSFRQYKYLRLDGSTTISDRRDMVLDWQTRPDLFIFLLSTRAGGLGINLTAADTVIFYDSDWNPSNDAQAMDRAHRLGQTKQVTVYRFITRNTVDERIVQLARNKKVVQDAVVGSSSVAADQTTKTSEVVSLLLDDKEMEDSMRQAELKRRQTEEQKKNLSKMGVKAREEYRAARQKEAGLKANARSSWEFEDDEDGFFSNANSGPAPGGDDDDLGGSGSGAGTAKGRKRKEQLGPDGQPKPKRRRRTKAEMGAARAAGEA
ncbi:putative DNA helicase ino80 [Microbotryomycetes sp. JL221]|nr:putative DNA helicase ino80 [Microbotryomycetes sp. JL221]